MQLNLLREWWGGGVDRRRRVVDWAADAHLSWNTTKKPISGLGKESKGREEEWIDTADVIWSEVAWVFGMAAVSEAFVVLGQRFKSSQKQCFGLVPNLEVVLC